MRNMDLKRAGMMLMQLFIGVVAVYLIYSAATFGKSSKAAQTEQMTLIIRQAAVQCYALEGAYPSDISYLADNYGIILNEEDYYYHYSLSIGSNIMPEVMVISKQ